MPLSRLENFLVNTNGNILYVNPSDLDATDSFDNKGNSLTRPFVTIQRALVEAARFSYQSGKNNDKFDRTTILLYPGEHVIDNRPGLYIKRTGTTAQLLDIDGNSSSESLLLNNSSIFDLNDVNNVLRRYNSVHGGVIVPKGTSIVGLDLRKTKIRPLYVPNPDVSDSVIPRSALFRVTGGCYFWQFSMFDANRAVYYSKDFTEKRNPRISHHKLTCFEYADGQNEEEFTKLTDLQMYYFKLMNAYGDDTGNREIINFPQEDGTGDFQPNTPESKIVGDLSPNDLSIDQLTSNGNTATVVTASDHGLTVDDQVLITGVGNTFYDGTYSVSGIGSETMFDYTMNGDPVQDVITIGTPKPQVKIEADSVTGASPYIFNCSLRSVFGMCGLHADGSKATGFKSMVVAQFTGIGLQKDDKAFVIYKPSTGGYIDSVAANSETGNRFRTPLYTNQNAVYRSRYENFHIKCSNDSFIQAVSVFAIGYANHFLSESGGEQSITNSNSNFGAKALVSKGFRKNPFNRDDTGYVTHIVPPKDLQRESTNISWRSLNVGLSTENIGGGAGVGETSRLYIDGETDLTNPPTNVSNGFKIGAKKNDILYLNVNLDGVPTTFTAPILMDVESGDGPSFEKRFIVDKNVNGNVITTGEDAEITLTANHNFLAGESVVVLGDDGRTPDGIKIGKKYFIILGSADNKIKLANTLNDALKSTPAAITIDNKLGGILSVVSRVTDKVPGDIGHPVQYDTTKNNWYILSSSTTDTNKIHEGIVGFSTQIKQNNSATYVQRVAETRALDDRIYRLRYVIPKEFTDTIAKKPEKNYTLQESKTVIEQVVDGTSSVITNRNPKIIAGISSTGSTVTVTSELPHKLSVNDVIRVNNVVSSTNATGLGNTGYNGAFTVVSTPSSKTFTYENTKLGGTFTNNLKTLRDGSATERTKLPSFERTEYDTTYTIQNVETIQDYVTGQQDGIYYLTCLIGNISPTASEFSNIKYKQNLNNLYPTIDKDNQDNDPVQAVSAASNELLGQVNVNDSINSITKETAINYLRDNRVGLAVTNGVSSNSGFTTLTSNVEHNLNSITSLSNPSGTNNNYPISTTLFNVELVNNTDPSADGATGNVTVNGSGSVTNVEIVDGGSGYDINDVLTVGTGNATVSVTSINNAVGKAIQVVGVGSIGDRNDSDYNGLFKIEGVPSSKTVRYKNIPQGQTASVSAGIYTGPVGTTNGIFIVLDDAVDITNIAGVAGTTLAGIITVTTQSSHGLSVGNKIKFIDFTGSAIANYNQYDFTVKGIESLTKFTVDTGSRVGTPVASAQCGRLLKYSLNSYGQDESLASEKISGSLSPILDGFSTTIDKPGTSGITASATTLEVSSTTGIIPGEFFQVDNEIVRVTQVQNASDLTVIRGVLGTQAVKHDHNSIIRKINPIPSELHRFSTIRASGHTFEYIGYGPGNYSTALPQLIERTLEEEEELLAISKEEKGGVVFFSGMNDRGDFFSGDRVEPRELILGEVGDSSSVTFDDVFIRNTLRVGGGANQNLPSEFNGPVNFTNKITSTDSSGGIEAIKLLIKGNALNNPSFQVGEDASPSLIVNKDSQNVGINTRNPNTNIELDVNGTIRAQVYENFKLTDLPDATEEPNYARNRIIKIKDDASGYELVDPHVLPAYELRSMGVSNDGTIYVGFGSIVGSKLQISGISTSKFYVGERVKMFGVTEVSDSVIAPPPVQDTGVKITKVGNNSNVTYFYWQAQYHLKNGKVGVSSQIDADGSYSGAGLRVGVANTTIDNFNALNHNTLSLKRSDTQHGLLIYRQIFDQETTPTPNVNNAKLIATLGQKELENNTVAITWKDFGVYEQTAWSAKGTVNEFLGSDSDTTLTNQIHFPVIARDTVGGRGWDIDQITEVGSNYITVSGNYNLNGTVGFGTTSSVKVVHDNTQALTDAISEITSANGNFLNLPSGTYLTNKLVIPSSFTLRGNGKNSIIKYQYYANDATSVGTVGSAGTDIYDLPDEDGILVGIGTTNPTDVTLVEVTFDGNSSNNLLFKEESENNLLSFGGGTSMLFKDMEIRNAGGGGLFARNSKRISVENSTIVDGGQTDRYNEFRPLDVQGSESVRVNDSLFENYPGSVDLSVTTVVATGGNIIRNCGSGIDAYATGKITTQNNILLGPSDEFLASPDIFDTDFDSINININAGQTFDGPELLYIENGEGYDLSSTNVTLTAGIGTIVGLYSTTRTASLGEKFFTDFTVKTQDSDGVSGRDAGYVRLYAAPEDANQPLPNGTGKLRDYVGSSTALGYEINAVEFQALPLGFTTFIGIQTGYWANQENFETIPGDGTGVGCTQYIIRLDDPGQITGIATGDVVKLVHETSPTITSTEMSVQKRLGSDRVVLTFPLITALQHGSTVVDDDYITIRRVFTIAKGRVGVT